MSEQTPDHARCFGPVADAYERARPSYPADAVAWLVGAGARRVLELGAGTGKLTRLLVDAGHEVVATDPSAQMLARLLSRVPDARVAVATAEQIPLPRRSVDVVVCAQSFHWFDHARALPEIARVLRPGGVLACVWNQRDEHIPWVRKLGRLIGTEGQDRDLMEPVRTSTLFETVEDEDFRFWQQVTADSLLDLVRSRSHVAVMAEEEREQVLARVLALYEGYGRGHDGMRLGYLTRCHRATLRRPDPVLDPPGPELAAEAEEPALLDLADPDLPPRPPTRPSQPPEDPGTLLIDYR